jgi:hypothetical protein
VCVKKYYNLAANSILESVIALSIISACLYIVILVYANAFHDNTSPTFYFAKNKRSTIYFMLQIRKDSVENNLDPAFVIEEEWEQPNLKKVTIRSKDSLPVSRGIYFIQDIHE